MTMTFFCSDCNCIRPLKDSKVDKTHGKQRICGGCSKRRRAPVRQEKTSEKARTV